LKRVLWVACLFLSMTAWGQSIMFPGPGSSGGTTSSASVVFDQLASTTGVGGPTTSGTRVYNGVNFGTATSDRYILVYVWWSSNGAKQPTAVTLNGTSMTQPGGGGFGCRTFAPLQTCVSIWVLPVPTTSSGNITVTYSNSTVSSSDAIAVFSLYGLITNTPDAASGGYSLTAPTANVNVLSGGLVITAAWAVQVPSPICAWTGAIFAGEIQTDPSTTPPSFLSVAVQDHLPAATPRSVSCTYNGTSIEPPFMQSISFH
jgi:hypothetical protein